MAVAGRARSAKDDDAELAGMVAVDGYAMVVVDLAPELGWIPAELAGLQRIERRLAGRGY